MKLSFINKAFLNFFSFLNIVCSWETHLSGCHGPMFIQWNQWFNFLTIKICHFNMWADSHDPSTEKCEMYYCDFTLPSIKKLYNIFLNDYFILFDYLVLRNIQWLMLGSLCENACVRNLGIWKCMQYSSILVTSV